MSFEEPGDDTMTEQTIVYALRGPVAVVTFNRPAVLNAISQAMLARLLEVLEQCARDDAVRVIVMTGSGRAFSAGIDLKELGSQLDAAGDGARVQLELAQELTRRLVRHPKVIIAAINGVAVGIGAELSVATDLRIASESATFAFPEVKRALFETNGVTYLLPRIVGLGKAMQWLLTGETVTAPDAQAAGLVNHIVPANQLLGVAIQLAEVIAANAPVSVGLVKRTLHAGYKTDLETILREEVEGVLQCMRTTDYREGVRAFLEKRDPVYQGH